MHLSQSTQTMLFATLLAMGAFFGPSSAAFSAGYLDRLEVLNSNIEDIDVAEIEPSFAGSFLAALSAGANGDDPAAIINYRRAIGFDPSNKNMNQSLFMALTADGQIGEAVELLKTLPAEIQTHNVNYIVIAANALKQKSWNRAVTSVDKISGSDLDNLITKTIGSWALFGDRKLPEAIERANSITGPEWVLMIKEYHLGLLNAAGGQDKEAVAHLEKAVGMRSVAGALTETYMRAVEALARSQAKLGDIDTAKKTAENGLELLLNHPPLLRYLSELSDAQKSAPLVKNAQQGGSEIFFNVGSAISRQGGLPFAQGHLQLARFLAPDSDVTLVALANSYSSQKKYVRANELFAEIEESSGYFRQAQLETGLNLNRMEQVREAEVILSKLVAESPKDAMIALSLGGVYGQHEEYEKAVVLYDNLLKQKSSPQKRDWILFYRRGIAHERTKNWPLAEADFNKALELSPDQPDVLNYLGYSWIDQGIRIDDGLDMVRKAVQLKPNSGFIIDSLGWAYYRLGKYEEAVKELTRALTLMPSDPVVNDHLGDAFWQTGRKLEAVFQWKHALSSKPLDEDKAKILKKIQSGLTH